MMRHKWLVWLVFGGLMATPAVAQAQQDNIAERLSELRKHEDRLVHIGERLSTAAAAAGWCEGGQSLGWGIAEIGQYPKVARAAARAEWSVPATASLYIASLAPDGAAAAAGMTVGLGIQSINGRPPMRNTNQLASNHARANSEQVIARALAEGPVEIVTVDGNGARRTWQLAGRPSCDTRFEMSADNEEQAFADGRIVQVTAGMGVFTNDNDAELAAVVAHELAHNILRHVARTEEAGTPRGYTRYLGRYTNITRSMEEEADRLSVWLLELAGFEPTSPMVFWERFGPGHDSAHPLGRTHDRWTDRVAALNNELALMRAAKATDPDVRPHLLDRRTIVPVPGQRAVVAPPLPLPSPASTPSSSPILP